MLISQLEKGEYKLENQYSRVVKPDGNPDARKVIENIFKVTDREWRGIGNIPLSGFEMQDNFSDFDANKKFTITIDKANECATCIAGEILRGIKKPNQCSEFGKGCTPLKPLGAPMVSSEGACAAYYHFSNVEI